MLRYADCQIITDVSRDDNSFIFRVEQSTILGLGFLAQGGLCSFEFLVIIYQSLFRNNPGAWIFNNTAMTA